MSLDFFKGFPEPGSPEERELFKSRQPALADIYNRVSSNRNEAHTTVIVPSLSLDEAELAKIPGTGYYEERLLCLLMLLKRPRSRIVFVSSMKIHPMITHYYLNFINGIPYGHAARRLIMLDANDMSSKPLTQKILSSPWLMDRISKAVGDKSKAHLVVFNTTPLERTLAVRLGLPIYGLDPDLHHLGNKSGCRRIFKEAGIPAPAGFEDLKDRHQIVEALDQLWQENDQLKRAVVKLNEGFAGQGNAIFDYRPIMEKRTAAPADRKKALEDHLHNLNFEAEGENWPSFEKKFHRFEGIVESFVEGDIKYSPSVQARINAIGRPEVISTHDQELGGPTGQQFIGCLFPAREDYRLMIQEDGAAVARVLSNKGVLGRFAVDFIVVPTANGFERYAIEINLRRGGTTHPFLMMKFLIEGDYDMETGHYIPNSGDSGKHYFATDYLKNNDLKGLGPDDLIDVAAYHQLHFHQQLQRGVVFHMLGAISQFGKLGVTSIGDDREDAQDLYRKTQKALQIEATEEGRKERMQFFLVAPQNSQIQPP